MIDKMTCSDGRMRFCIDAVLCISYLSIAVETPWKYCLIHSVLLPFVLRHVYVVLNFTSNFFCRRILLSSVTFKLNTKRKENLSESIDINYYSANYSMPLNFKTTSFLHHKKAVDKKFSFTN